MYSEIARNKRNSVFLIGGFLVFIILLCWAFSLAFDNQLILYGGVVFSLSYSVISYFASASMVLSISGAREVQKKDAPQLYRTVENLAITAGLPTPKVYIIDDTAPNAFATGRDPQHGVVCVTAGLLQQLDKKELEGVIAHELSHIDNYDVRFMTLVVILVGIIVLLSDWLLRVSFWGGRRSNDSGGLQPIMMLVAIVLALLAPLVGLLMQLAFSRRREYLADASGAMLTRYPEGLADALRKIEADTQPLREANRATADLYIINPLRDNVEGNKTGWFANLFSSHPPTRDRIKRLEQMDIKP